MIRICNTLSGLGYQITLVGVKRRNSSPLQEKKYRQTRLTTFFSRGCWFYAEYNLRLLIYLLFCRATAICSIDLDTILPVWLAGTLKNTKRIYDAHEYFSQQKEIITRPWVYKIWFWIERVFVPKFSNGYTIGGKIAEEFKLKYGVDYEVIRNIPLLNSDFILSQKKDKTILYQGAVNEARGLEYLVPAMKNIPARLLIYGDGNMLEGIRELIALNNLEDKVLLKGKQLPEQLNDITPHCYIGLNLVENTGLNQYYSLANKFFDYIHSGLPQVTMNFPEYKMINDQFETAALIDELSVASITAAINKLLNEEDYYNRLKQNCFKAMQVLNWQNEEKKLIAFYERVLKRK